MPDLIDIDCLERYDKNLKGILKVWSKKTDYSLNDVVEYKGNYIECTTAGRSGTTTLNFTNVNIGDTITDGTVTWTVIKPPSTGSGLNDWIANTQYKIDSIVVNDGQIYKSLVEFISGSTFDNIEILEDYVLQTGDTPILWAEGTEINTNDIVEYNSNYYKALYNFTCGSTFTKNVFEEYVPKSLTQAQIDAIVDNYNPVYSAATGVEYSTEERKVGTWIDGKPLYQKTFQTTTPSTINTYGNIITNLGSINVISITGYLVQSDVPHHVMINSVIDNVFVCAFFNSEIQYNGSICMRTNLNHWTSCNCCITIQYTKTTD